ncbi:MAG: hypothetical protein IIA61_13760 [Candidatus Marinimicrobia bacterium]|nr:hypothetical protein [Candidatus Neomarinimicrobiota bacterium]
MPLPLDERIELAAQLIKRARIFYDVWWFYEGTGTRPRILDTMNRYSEFFRFDTHAHFVSMVVHLAGLFETRSDTINFTALVDELDTSGLFPPEDLGQAQDVIKEIQNLPSKLAILRSNLFAHRSASLSYKEAFRKADVTPNQLRDLTVAGLRIANILLHARGLPEQHFHELSRKDAERLLHDLAQTKGT